MIAPAEVIRPSSRDVRRLRAPRTLRTPKRDGKYRITPDLRRHGTRRPERRRLDDVRRLPRPPERGRPEISWAFSEVRRSPQRAGERQSINNAQKYSS